MNTLTIGLAQVCQTDDIETNARTILDYIEKASAAGVQILCFPEAQTVGYRADITAAGAPVPIVPLSELHAQVSRRCAQFNMACILGTEIPAVEVPSGQSKDIKPFNSVIVISEKGHVLGTHHKTKLTPLDAMAYTAGEKFETFDLFGIRVGVVICFEGFRFAETTRECVRQGAQLMFHPQNNTTRPNDWKVPIHHAMIVTRAAENTIWFASCNACLEHQNSRSMIVAPNGQIVAQSELKQEQLVVSEIDITLATRAMFNYDLRGCAELLFADTVDPQEYAAALP